MVTSGIILVVHFFSFCQPRREYRFSEVVLPARLTIAQKRREVPAAPTLPQHTAFPSSPTRISSPRSDRRDAPSLFIILHVFFFPVTLFSSKHASLQLSKPLLHRPSFSWRSEPSVTLSASLSLPAPVFSLQAQTLSIFRPYQVLDKSTRPQRHLPRLLAPLSGLTHISTPHLAQKHP